MLLRTRFIGGLCVTATLLACGGKEKAKDPTEEKTSYSDETPKWEGAGAGAGAGTADPKSHGPEPVEKPKRRKDEYDREGTEVSLKRAARQVKDNCGQAKDENGKAIGPWGKVTVQVQLGHNGHSKGTIVPSPFQGKPSGNCVEMAFSNLTFPPWSGADTQVDWDIEIIEPAKEATKPATK